MLNKKMKTCALLFLTTIGAIGLSGCNDKKPSVPNTEENEKPTTPDNGENEKPVIKTGSVIILDTEHGKVTVDKTTGNVGDTVSVTVEADEGYNIVSLKVGNKNLVVSAGKASFKIEEGQNVISSKFAYKTGAVTITEIQNGKVEADKLEGKIGDTITLTVIADENYALKELKLGDEVLEVSKENKATFVLKEGQNVVSATFVILTGTVKYWDSDEYTIEVSKKTGNVGDEITATVKSNFGFSIKEVTVANKPYKLTDNKFTFKLVAGNNWISVSTDELACVKFMVKNDKTNKWELLERKIVNEGTVVEPVTAKTNKKYYQFKGWYTDTLFTEKYTNSGLKGITKVYANYTANEVTVHIGAEKTTVKNMIDVVNARANQKDGNTTIKWYTDASKNIEWDGVTEVKDLYTEEVALVTFNNGYEDVYVAAVKPNSKMANPNSIAVEVDGKASTLEKAEIVEYYMDEEDVYYKTETGEDFNFDSPIADSTKVIVEWNTKNLKKSIRYDETSKNYRVEPSSISSDLQEAPVYSVSSHFHFDKKTKGEDGKTTTERIPVTIAGFESYSDNLFPSRAKKLIFGEGIKFISGLDAAKDNMVEEISLPTTIKIIDNSFSNMPNLKGVTLPEGLEVLIGSFYKESLSEMSNYKDIILGTNYDFQINIPASVKNLAMVPTNLTFAKGSKFYKEGGRIYLNKHTTQGDKKVLISDNDAINKNSKTIVIPEGVQGIQTGTYNIMFDYLYVPSTFEFVNYNEDVKNYPYYHYMTSSWTGSSNHLFDKTNIAAPNEHIDASAYSITKYVSGSSLTHYDEDLNPIFNSEGAGQVIFANNTLPAGINRYAFAGDPVQGFAVMNNGYVGLDNPQLLKNIHFGNEEGRLFISFNANGIIIKDVASTLKTNALTSYLDPNFTVEDLLAEIKFANPNAATNIDAAVKDKKLELVSGKDNSVITIDEKGQWRQKVLEAKFVTINIK